MSNPLSLITEGNERSKRAYNIAVVIISLYEKKACAEVSNLALREFIREQLNLPVLSGEARNGDIRAHGDSLGGHMLNLEHRATAHNGQRVKYILISEKNYKTCKDFIKVYGVDKDIINSGNQINALLGIKSENKYAKAYNEGSGSAWAGHANTACPYPHGGELADRWLAGFKSMTKKITKELK